MDLELLVGSWLRADENGNASGLRSRGALGRIADVNGLADARWCRIGYLIAERNKHPAIPVLLLFFSNRSEVAEPGQDACEVA